MNMFFFITGHMSTHLVVWARDSKEHKALELVSRSGGLAGGAGGATAPPADFFRGAPKFARSTKNSKQFDLIILCLFVFLYIKCATYYKAWRY